MGGRNGEKEKEGVLGGRKGSWRDGGVEES